MFGDYEAQRHWQEITLNLPIEKWYINTTDNNLMYWGLDYPPLTAYHSLLLGYIANLTDTSFVRLHASRGVETSAHKYFMRFTVLVSDLLIYIPAIIYFFVNLEFFKNDYKKANLFNFGKKELLILAALIYPGLILIDHGHFQYNCVSLGLFVGAVGAIFQNAILLASFLFTLALNYKQMELYHALPFFFYILGRYKPGKNKSIMHSIGTLFLVSSIVILTFLILWLPFLYDWKVLKSVILRLFPLARGVFEDKVANIWCSINIIFKLKLAFTNLRLAQICLITTLIAVLPTCLSLYLKPTKEKFLISLINTSLSFFLFSYQVHEKSILLVAIPALLHFPNDPLPCFWLLLISDFSMLPLFIKDHLYLAYLSTLIFYYFSISWMFHNELFPCEISTEHKDRITKSNADVSIKSRTKPKLEKIQKGSKKNKGSAPLQKYKSQTLKLILFTISMLGALTLSIASISVKPPEKYPDLFPLLISVYSCAHFSLFYLYFNYKQIFSNKKSVIKFKIK
ncbi:probable dolichyl pyrophosphate Man9GlcNAc2 alpha-1,3-glucosyltransferase isoform X2 [Prorops nasuta]